MISFNECESEQTEHLSGSAQTFSAWHGQILANMAHIREATILLALLQPAPEVSMIGNDAQVLKS